MSPLPKRLEGQLVFGQPIRFDGKLWSLIAKRIPELQSPHLNESDLLPLAEEILVSAVKEWGTPVLEDSPKNPAGRRTPGWEAVNDPFDPK